MLALRLLLPLGLLMFMPVATAHHWERDVVADKFVDSDCFFAVGIDGVPCYLAYLCTGSAPPQVVDLTLHCATRAGGEAEDIALWGPFLAWWFLDYATNEAETVPHTLNAITQGERDTLNAVLCDSIWSGFCTNPLALPEHMPIADPIGPYPL